MRTSFLIGSFCLFFIIPFTLSAQNAGSSADDENVPEGYQVQTYIDNQGYWLRMARLGLTRLNPNVISEPAQYKGSSIKSRSVTIEDSPDVAVTDAGSTQSENSVFIDPGEVETILNSNNSLSSSGGTLYGADGLYSFDTGESWEGTIYGTGGTNSGDPSVAIGTNGWFYNGFINSGSGQSCSYSSDQGQTWISVTIAPKPSGFSSLLDKNHLTIDNSTSSPYEGNLYSGWTSFGGSSDNEIEVARSTDGGLSWQQKIMISEAINAGSHNQGVNLQTGPAGEVYAVWAIYDNWPGDENALGFAASLDGGATFQPAQRIIQNIKGIRNTTAGKNHRVNSFPSMAVDISNSSYSGNIYVVWPNVGVPGTNQGPDIYVYMIRSTDGGTTWSTPIKVNQDPMSTGKKHYFPWIACDPVTGTLSVIFYDDRNVSSNQVETWVANSMDGGQTWDDFRVSDVAFSPTPIPGTASGYFGDYLGISARGGVVVPCWTDNRTGAAMTYVSPFTTPTTPNPASDPIPSNGANNVEPFAALHWKDFNNRSSSFRLYLGTDNPPTNIVNGATVQDTFYIPQADFNFQEQYFWRVKSINSFGSALSPIWSFSTEARPDEDFETGNFSKNEWSFSGNANWVINTEEKRNGTYSAASGQIGHSQSSSLMIDLEVKFSPFATSMSFWKKTSTQPGADILQFLMDGTVLGEWSGETDWSEESFIITTGGIHTFEWRYTKDGGSTGGEDRVWIDYVTFPLLEQLLANAGPNATICEGSPFTLSGTANNQTSVLWTTSGDGTFSNPAILKPDYTPGPGDIQNGDVTLTLTAFDETDQVSDDMQLSIQGTPFLEMEENFTICAGEIFSTEGTIAENYASLTWTTSGDGTFDDNTLLSAAYTPGPGDIANGSFGLTLVLTGLYPCGDVSGSMTVTVTPLPAPASTPAGPEMLCQNAGTTTYSVTSIAGASSYLWNLNPEEAGVLTADGTSLSVVWTPEFWGTAELSVLGVNDCGEGPVSEPLQVTLEPLPLQPAAPVGETYVCINFVDTSYYVTSVTEFASLYEWSINPPEAGVITGSDTTGIIAWNQQWTGIAHVTVRGVNDCGEGAWSESIQVILDICGGLEEKTTIDQITLFPNPSNGTFTLRMTTTREDIFDLKVLNALNSVVYEKKNVTWTGTQEMEIGLKDVSSGTYVLYLENSSTTLVRKIMVR
ncbi:MAG TPA: T9SS type A sorting domain-containing protein [Bacteroidales bacterium]|nr:T9SS type A sorting domain-containing protein [Bacteroidales bacterium]